MWLLLYAGVACWSVGVSQASVSSSGVGVSPLVGALVVPGVESLDGAQQQREVWEARLRSPEAVFARQRSRRVFAGESGVQAAGTLGQAFPSLVDDLAGGPPRLGAGQRITGYLSDDVARVALAGGRHGVIESGVPMAREMSPGRRVPLDLSLSDLGDAFVPRLPAVAVWIPKRLGAGVRLEDMGVSLTPVDGSGSPLVGSEGVLDGSGVFYGRTQTDADTVVKPTSLGVDEDTVLRSVASPQQLFFRLGLPTGAGAVMDGESGVVRVVDAGRVLAMVLPPSAVDAEGTSVPVSVSLRDGLLVLSVDHRSGSFRYPILVDPGVVDPEFLFNKTHSNWTKETNNEAVFYFYAESNDKAGFITNLHDATYHKNDFGEFIYPTQGESRIYQFEAEVFDGGDEGAPVATAIALGSNKGVIERERKVGEPGGVATHERVKVCTSEPSCKNEEAITEANDNNRALLVVSAVKESHTYFESFFDEPVVWIAQEKAPSARLDTTDATLSGHPNAAYGGWVNTSSTSSAVLGVDAFDPGIGVDAVSVSVPGLYSWGPKETPQMECAGAQCSECYENKCANKLESKPLSLPFTELGELPEGEDTVHATVEDATGELKATATGTIKVDNIVPYGLSLTGLPASKEVTEDEYPLKAEASAGAAGIKSIALAVDGRELGSPSSGCSGKCTAKGEWSLSGANFGVGEHKLTMTATDNAGNVTTETYTFKVHHAAPVPLGPGAVNPQSGEVSLAATDVSVAAAGANLTVERYYRSRHLTAGSEGPLGAQWSLSVGGQESITKLPTGSATLTSGDGGQSTFTATGEGKFASPPGDSSLTLSEGKNSKGELVEYVLTSPANDTTTRFTSLGGPTATLWKPTKQEGPISSQKVRYIYQTSEGVTEPKYALAPEPAGLSFSCAAKLEKAEKLEKGCRALEFKYATSTTATGENASQWKEYKGRLSEVIFIAYIPATKAMSETAEAQYAYDSQGRLRAEWDPQTNLKTTYGYDGESHVTAVSSPGQQPWLLHYGSIASNANTGHLLSVIRPEASTAAGNGIAPANSAAPTLSSTKPVVGTKISVSTNGTWSNSPLNYSYQWEDCNSAGAECTPIPEAVNQSYYPAKSDEGHTLVAQVSAMNATGTVAAVSEQTSVVATGTPSGTLPEPPSPGTSSIWTVDYHVGLAGSELQTMTPSEVERWGQTEPNDPAEATAFFSPDEPMGWPAKEYKRATVRYFDSKGRTVNIATPGGGVASVEYNALNDVVRTLSPDNRAAALKYECESKEKCKSAEVAKELDSESVYEEKGSEPGAQLLSTLGPEHTVKLASGSTVAARDHKEYSYDAGAPSEGGPYRLVTKETEGAQYSGKEADVRTTATSYEGQKGLGWKLRKPTLITTNPGGLNLAHSYTYEESTGNLKETSSPAGVTGSKTLNYLLTFGSTGHENGEFETPTNAATDSSGDVWVVDYENNRIEEFSSAGTWLANYGKAGTSETELDFERPVGIAINQSSNDVYVTDQNNNRVVKFSASTGKVIRVFGKDGNKAGEFTEPHGVALDGKGHLWVVDSGNNRLEEFNEEGTYLKTVGEKGTTCGDFTKPSNVAISGEDMYVTDAGNSRVEKFTEEGKTCTQFGTAGTGAGQFKEPNGIAVGPTGHPFVVDQGNDRVQEFSATGAYLATYGAKGTGAGEFSQPRGITILSSGVMYVTDASTANRVEKWGPTANGARTTQTFYYTAGTEAEIATCRSHPEWAGLPCQTQPANQPETGGMPNLPVTTYTYNVWDEPETTTETVEITKTESKTRTKTNTYDTAGRLKTEAISSTVGTALPTVTYAYNSETGALEKQSTTSNTITSIYNKLGQLESYTDADENKSTYEYDVDGRIKKTNDGKGTQTYTYSETSGLLTELVDSSQEGMKFTATYDVEGNILTEGYPNGMTASYSYNQVGSPTSLQYKKISDCTEEKEKCVWFKDTVVPSIHGQWLEQTSTLSHQAYSYDNAGRLTEVQNTPTGKGCTTRIYAYDEDTNRLNLTTREPNSKKECAAEGTSSETQEPHIYDTADRLADPGISYNTFGDITALPAADAGAATNDELTSTYYVDNQLASQTQEGETIGYNLDPAKRVRETVDTGKKTFDLINHYAGPSDSPAWSKTSNEWTRNIPGITGSLTATQTSGNTPVLQLTNLHGDIIATAYLSETATALASTADTSEYGVPAVSAPTKYSWLGAIELPTELPSGVIEMGARSYVPQLGRFLQPDPIPGGSANAYSYTYGDPVNTSDPSGAYTATADEADRQLGMDVAAAATEAYELHQREAEEKIAAIEAAARLAAEEAAEQAAAAGETAGPQYAGEEEYEEWWEEEGSYGYEYASNHQGSESGKPEAHVEAAVLYQPLQESGGEVEAKAKAALRLCQDAAGGAGKVEACARYASIFGKIGHWVDKHIIKPVEHFVHEIVTNLPRCYPNEIEGGGQCSSAPPGYGDDPFYPVF
jgi:RHS repeat-associated protein